MGMPVSPLTFVLLFAAAFTQVVTATAPAQQPSAAEIMKKVAANQDRAQKERANFVYEAAVKVATRRTNGKLAREENTDYFVVPTPNGVERKRQLINGRYWYKGHYLDFNGDPVPDSGSLDAQLTAGFRDDLLDDKSKDGIGKDLFPLTTDQQTHLKFEIVDQPVVSGRKAYRVRFGPADKNDIAWVGEAVIDQEEFQPISVYTRLSRRLPLVVRTLFGTDVPGLGFNATYARIDKNLWFPVSFGTEFRLRAVFFINRVITLSMENKNFKRTTAKSEIHYGPDSSQ